MIADKLLSSVSSVRSSARWIQWLSVLFALMAIAIGVGIAVSVGEFGPLILFSIPLLVMFLLALGQPQLGMMAFIIITITQLSNVGIKNFGLPSLAQPLAGLLLLLILVRITLFGERPEGWLRAGPLLIIYVMVWFASMLHAGNFLAARDSFFGFAKDALGGVIVIFFIQRPSSFKGAIWALILAAMFVSAICVFQVITGTYSNSYLGFGKWILQTSGSSTNHRLTGPYDNPNAFAQMLVFIIPLAVDRLWHERTLILRIVAGLAALLSILTVVFTYSRGGLLAMMFMLGMLLILRRPNFMPWFITAVMAVLIIQFLPASYNTRIVSLLQFTDQSGQVSDQSFIGRSSENLAAWQMFVDNPILGVGLGNFQRNYQSYSRVIGLDSRRDARAPASLYLELLATQGIVGFAIFGFLIVLVFRELRSARKNFLQSGLIDESHIIIAIVAGLAGYLFAAINKNSAYANVFWVFIGIALSSGQVAHASRVKFESMLSNQSGNGKA
jgi:O-antigen ligase